MRCDKVKDMLASSVRDKTCSDAERALVDSHLEGCFSCRLFRDALGSAMDALSAAPRLTPPPAVWSAIEERLDTVPARTGMLPGLEQLAEGWRRWWSVPVARPAFALAGVALVCALVVMVAPNTPGSGTAPVQLAAGTESDSTVEDDIIESGFGSLAEEMAFSDDLV